MRYAATLAALGFVLAVTATAGAVMYDIDTLSSTWTQTPADGSVPSVVTAMGLFDTTPPTLGLFDLSAMKLSPAVASTRPGYDWETEYTAASVDISVIDLLTNDGITIDSIESLVNYNNNDTTSGLPNEFLFVGEGFTDAGLPYTIEAYWNDQEGTLTFDPTNNGIQGNFVNGSLTVVPEPVTMAGLMLGVGALGGYLRRRRA